MCGGLVSSARHCGHQVGKSFWKRGFGVVFCHDGSVDTRAGEKSLFGLFFCKDIHDCIWFLICYGGSFSSEFSTICSFLTVFPLIQLLHFVSCRKQFSLRASTGTRYFFSLNSFWRSNFGVKTFEDHSSTSTIKSYIIRGTHSRNTIEQIYQHRWTYYSTGVRKVIYKQLWSFV